MKNILYILLTVLALIGLCCSCGSSDDKHEYIELGDKLDFGKGVYRPNPFQFLDSIPPFSWMGMPDSVKKTTELVISFNEDAVRSKSAAQLTFVDINGNRIEDIKVGKSDGSNLSLKANTAQTIVPIIFSVNPNIGDSILNGSIVILGNDLDEANGKSLGTTMTPVATWSLEHETGINWWRWILLILVVAIILCLIAMIIYLLYHGIIWIASKFSSLGNHSFGKILRRAKTNQGKSGKKKKEKKEDKEKEDRERDPFIVACEHKLLSSYSSLSQKASILERLFIYWDYDLLESKKEYEAKMLNKRIMDAMDSLWYRNTFYKYTKKGMTWSGLELDSTLIPNPTVTPRNRNYSNIDHLTWGEIMEKHKFHGLNYHRGKPNFSQIALYTVQLSNFDCLVDSNSDTERGPLQEEAFRILANNLHKTVEEIRFYKEQNRLVWHEDTDCKTLYLVPQEIHNNLHHLGGIGMLKILRKSGLY